MPPVYTFAQKLALIQRVEELAPKIGIEAACRKAGVKKPTFYVWQKQVDEHGEARLVNRTGGGRPVAFDLTDDERSCLRDHVAGFGSFALGVEQFAKDRRCSTATREKIHALMARAAAAGRRSPHWPPSLMRAGQWSDDLDAYRKGGKTWQAFEGSERRAMQWEDADGRLIDLRAGDLFESDDESVNEDFRYTDPADGLEKLGRQTLKTVDVYSYRFLSCTALGRPKDAYRVEDIAAHCLSTIDACGLPLAWRFERGVWENNCIDGVPLDELGREGQRWGGWSALFEVLRAFKSKAKGTVEGSFNLRQAMAAGLSHGRTVHIGRYAGEMEAASKLERRAKDGDERALAKFWTIEEFYRTEAEVLDLFNNRPKERQAWNGEAKVPEELWRQHPGKRELPAAERWRFLPVKAVRTVLQNEISVAADHYEAPFAFAANGDPDQRCYLPHGTKVLVAFHPAYPDQGCQVFMADQTSRNAEGLPFGTLVGTMPHKAAVPQFRLGSGGDHTARKATSAAVRSEFLATTPSSRGGVPTHVRASVARDGLGARIVEAKGLPAAEEAIAPAPQPSRGTPAAAPESAASRRAALEAKAKARAGNILA